MKYTRLIQQDYVDALLGSIRPRANQKISRVIRKNTGRSIRTLSNDHEAMRGDCEVVGWSSANSNFHYTRSLRIRQNINLIKNPSGGLQENERHPLAVFPAPSRTCPDPNTRDQSDPSSTNGQIDWRQTPACADCGVRASHAGQCPSDRIESCRRKLFGRSGEHGRSAGSKNFECSASTHVNNAIVDFCFGAPSPSRPRIQETHATIYHTLIELTQRMLEVQESSAAFARKQVRVA